MAKLYDISDWQQQGWNKPPKGSRTNNVYQNPETGELFYFKLSKDNFPAEFWSEIIASKIGNLIGFKVLEYHIGYNKGILGCLSKSMIDKEQGTSLYHGVDVLNDYIEHFVITDKPIYSFQDLQQLCSENIQFKDFIENFVEIIVFDALIGNTDRHTENWAFIIGFLAESQKNIEFVTLMDTFKFIWRKKKYKPVQNFINKLLSFAPIYDSGSCLGREIHESKIDSYLQSVDKIQKYIEKGKSEIRWETSMVDLFELVQKAKSVFPALLAQKLSNLHSLNDQVIKNIVFSIDNELLTKGYDSLLSPKRKTLICQILMKRLAKLQTILEKP